MIVPDDESEADGNLSVTGEGTLGAKDFGAKLLSLLLGDLFVFALDLRIVTGFSGESGGL